MDISRQILNTLMGRDRNKPKDKINSRDHYSNRDVCKPFLVCFCFNTLFPNTVYDEGPCAKRHDTYLKTMFDSDISKSEYERDYIRECISWIEKRLIDVEQKIKKNQGVIDNKSSYSTDRPKLVLDRIIGIDQDIEKMMQQAQTFGENGQIDDSSRCLEEVQRLRERRKQIQLMGDNMMTTQKQQKICEICGAIQTINDTEKRIQTHLEGKIHQGFLKLRHQVETLRVRLQILNDMDGTKKEKQRVDPQPFYNVSQTKVQKDINKEKSKSLSPSKKKKKDKERQRQNQNDHYEQSRNKDRNDRDRQKDKHREHKDHKERDHKEKEHKEHKQRDRDHKDRQRDPDREKKEHKKKHKKERSRSRSRDKHEKHEKYYS